VTVRLYEPDGTPNLLVALAYAIEYCETHVGWSWAYTADDDGDYEE
jgi:hypothetical protein